MKTETEVFFKETKPFIDSLCEVVNPQYCLNMTWNYQHIMDMQAKRDINMTVAEPGSKGPAIVIGSGPSLDAAMPYLNKARKKHKAPIFATASQVWSLYYMGVTPDYVTQHDPWSRNCPLCGTVELSHIHFEPDGEIYCAEDHHITDPDMILDLKQRTHISRYAPEIGCKVMFQPGVQLEPLRWKDVEERGEMYFCNLNPNIGPVDTRSLLRGQVYARAVGEFRRLPVKAQQSDEAWKALLLKLINAPGFHEPQDIPMWLSVILFGEGNARVRNPVHIAAPYAPSTTFQNAVNAYMKGYNPIYFVGYDLCNWKHIPRHRQFYYDGSEAAKSTANPNPAALSDFNGYPIDYVKIGEKYALAGYVSKQVNGHYSLPGIEIVECIAEGTPGNLEFYPRIDIERFAKGDTVNVKQTKTGPRINAILKERGISEGWK